MAKRDYYEILGLTKSASADEIRRAHRKLVRQYHPDVNPKASDKFKEVQEAYDVLSDDSAKKKYDQVGHEPDMAEQMRRAAEQQRSAGGSAYGRGPGSYTWQSGPGGPTVEDFDFGDAGGMGGIFEQLFGGGRAGGGGGRQRGRGRAQAQKGSDVEQPVSLSFLQAARGTTLSLQLSREGDLETLEVKIPAGVKDGSRIRIKGKGNGGSGGDGDLFIITTIQPHPYFKRDGLDVLLELPISLYEALNGTKISVPTLDGPVTLTIPPGASSHAKLRIPQRGIFRGDEKGDQLVILRVVLPKGLDEEDKKAIETIAGKHPLNPRADLKW